MPTPLQILLICLLAPATIVMAQDKPAMTPSQDNPLSTFNKHVYGHVKDILLRSAEKNAGGELLLLFGFNIM
jgi:hypothetical protein